MGRHGIFVVVGIPSFGMVSTYFLQARQSQQFPLVSSSVDRIVLNKPIAEARNEIVEFALSQDATYIYWLDDDVIPPGDAFLKLWKHQKDIINGVYWSKSNPPMPLLFRGHLEGPYLNWRVGDLIEIDAAGNGLTLVKTDVYRKISQELGGPWYETDYGSFPGIRSSAANNTEDLYFYWKAKKVGYKVWADTSIQAYHYEKTQNVLYGMPQNSPQSIPAWELKPKGSKLIADLGSGAISPYFSEGEVVSFDIREDVKPDVLCDIRRLPVPDETFDIIFSSHTLEHFGWRDIDKVLKEWTRALKVGGELRLVVPNLRHTAQRILDDSVFPSDFWVIYGEQDYQKNFHATGFTPNLLRDLIASTGVYEDIQIREGDFTGPPAPDAWNLMAKATKVKNIEVDNIAPEGTSPGPQMPQYFPFRIYDESKQREMTEEEVYKDLEWIGAASISDKKKDLIEKAKVYPITEVDLAYFKPEQLQAEQIAQQEEVKDGLDSDNKGITDSPRRKRRKTSTSG